MNDFGQADNRFQGGDSLGPSALVWPLRSGPEPELLGVQVQSLISQSCQFWLPCTGAVCSVGRRPVQTLRLAEACACPTVGVLFPWFLCPSVHKTGAACELGRTDHRLLLPTVRSINPLAQSLCLAPPPPFHHPPPPIPKLTLIVKQVIHRHNLPFFMEQTPCAGSCMDPSNAAIASPTAPLQSVPCPLHQ